MELRDPETGKLRTNRPITILILIGAYCSILGGLIGGGLALASRDPVDLLYGLAVSLGMLAIQCLFIFTAGTHDLVEPVRPRRQILPLLVFAGMAAVLILGLFTAAGELIFPNPENNGLGFPLMIGFLMMLWGVWLALIITASIGTPRIRFFRRIVLNLAAGSLLELLISVPAHLVVIRRPGCFVGLGTMLGIFAGVLVLIVTAGPAMVWLMMHVALTERDKVELKRARLRTMRGTV